MIWFPSQVLVSVVLCLQLVRAADFPGSPYDHLSTDEVAHVRRLNMQLSWDLDSGLRQQGLRNEHDVLSAVNAGMRRIPEVTGDREMRRLMNYQLLQRRHGASQRDRKITKILVDLTKRRNQGGHLAHQVQTVAERLHDVQCERGVFACQRLNIRRGRSSHESTASKNKLERVGSADDIGQVQHVDPDIDRRSHLRISRQSAPQSASQSTRQSPREPLTPNSSPFHSAPDPAFSSSGAFTAHEQSSFPSPPQGVAESFFNTAQRSSRSTHRPDIPPLQLHRQAGGPTLTPRFSAPLPNGQDGRVRIRMLYYPRQNYQRQASGSSTSSSTASGSTEPMENEDENPFLRTVMHY